MALWTCAKIIRRFLGPVGLCASGSSLRVISERAYLSGSAERATGAVTASAWSPSPGAAGTAYASWKVSLTCRIVYGWLLAIGGLAYVAAVAFFRWRG